MPTPTLQPGADQQKLSKRRGVGSSVSVSGSVRGSSVNCGSIVCNGTMTADRLDCTALGAAAEYADVTDSSGLVATLSERQGTLYLTCTGAGNLSVPAANFGGAGAGVRDITVTHALADAWSDIFLSVVDGSAGVITANVKSRASGSFVITLINSLTTAADSNASIEISILVLDGAIAL